MRRYFRTSICESAKIVDMVEQPNTLKYLVLLRTHHLTILEIWCSRSFLLTYGLKTIGPDGSLRSRRLPT